MNTNVLIELDDVGIGHGRQPFLRGITLEVVGGDYLGLVGPNGAGKTTFLQTMLGSRACLGGEVTIDPGIRVGYVPQRTRIDPIFPLSAVEVVRSGGLGLKTRGQDSGLFHGASRRDAVAALERVGLGDYGSKPFRELSGGQQQRVLIARALVRAPDLLVLDEPTAGMDIPSEHELLEFIGELNRTQGTAVVLVVHQISLVAGRVSKLCLINKDLGLFRAGRAEDLLSSEVLSKLYGVAMDRNGAVVRQAGARE